MMSKGYRKYVAMGCAGDFAVPVGYVGNMAGDVQIVNAGNPYIIEDISVSCRVQNYITGIDTRQFFSFPVEFKRSSGAVYSFFDPAFTVVSGAGIMNQKNQRRDVVTNSPKMKRPFGELSSDLLFFEYKLPFLDLDPGRFAVATDVRIFFQIGMNVTFVR